MQNDWLTVGEGGKARRIAIRARPGVYPDLLWLGGYRSDMYGTKAEELDKYAAKTGRSFRRFDYSGHGASEGVFEESTISNWLEEARQVLALSQNPQIVVGSSMGGWLALLLADEIRRRGEMGRIVGLILIAPAVDMTHALMWERMSKVAQKHLADRGIYFEPNPYGGEPTPITKKLIDDGAKHLFGDGLIGVGCPVHILQGMRDAEVPWRDANELLQRLASDDVVLTLVKDGDHRLSRPEDLSRLTDAVEEMIREVTASP
jgi:pimeloyl-ACP methyl ester carboxylesterase